MCNVILATTEDIENSRVNVYPGIEYEATAVQKLFDTRVQDHVIICKHADGKWELTPELKEGEVLEIPADATIKFIPETEWKEMNVGG